MLYNNKNTIMIAVAVLQNAEDWHHGAFLPDGVTVFTSCVLQWKGKIIPSYVFPLSYHDRDPINVSGKKRVPVFRSILS